MEKNHKDKVKKMEMEIKKLEEELEKKKNQNKVEEKKLREEYKKADSSYQEMINAYDLELVEASKEKQKALEQFLESHHDLEQVRVDYQ